MGEHKGWRLRDRGGAVLAEAWDPQRKAYTSKTFRGDRARSDATAWAKQKHADLRAGTDQSGRASTRSLLEEWLKDGKRRGKRALYLADCDRILGYAIEAGVTDLLHPALTARVESWLAEARCVHARRAGQPLSPATRNQYLAILRALVHWSMRRGYLRHDVLAGVQAERVPRSLKPTFSLDELHLLLSDQCRQKPRITRDPVPDDYWLPFAIAIYTGLRTGELSHLRWEWFRWTEQTLHVRQVAGLDLKGQKERRLPLQPELAAILHPLAKPAGWVLEDDRVRSSRAYHRRALAPFLTRHGVPVAGRTPHSTRHTWVSLLIATGEPDSLVQAYAGHTSVTTTAGYAAAAADYRKGVSTWPRGEFRLRPAESAAAPGARPTSA